MLQVQVLYYSKLYSLSVTYNTKIIYVCTFLLRMLHSHECDFCIVNKKVSPAVLEKNAQRTTEDNDRQRKNVSFTDQNTM